MISFILTAGLAWATDVTDGATKAVAGAAGQQQGGLTTTLVMLGVMFAFFYFFLIRPQQKKEKERQIMLNAIQRGDRVQTSGGLIGQVTGLDQSELTIEIAPQIRVKVGRGFVTRVIRLGDSGGEKEKK